MATQHPNTIGLSMATYPVLTDLSLLTEGAYLDFVKAFPAMSESYILAQEAQSGVLVHQPQKQWYRWEDKNKPLGAFKVVSDATGQSAGASVTVTLTASSHKGSGKYSPVVIGRIYEDNYTGIRYKCEDVDASNANAITADLVPVNSSQTANISAANSYLMDMGRLSTEEASDQMDGQYRTYEKVSRTLSAIREDVKFSDLASFEVLDIKGQTYRQLSLPDFDKRMIDVQEHKLMFKTAMNNVAGEGLENSTDLGLIPQIQAGGNTLTTGGAITDALFEDFKRIQSANGGTKEFDVLVDPEVTIAMQKYLESKTGLNGGAIFADFTEGDPRANFDFAMSIKYFGVKLNLKEYAYLNKARTHGAEPGTGVWAGSMVFIPQGEFINPDGKYQRLFTIKYMSDSPIGAVVHTMHDGGLLGQGTEAVAKYSHLTWKSIDVQRPWEFFYGNINN